MNKINILSYTIEETARVAADYNFYWNIGNTKSGIEITFTTSNRCWSKTVTIESEYVDGLSEKSWQALITVALEKTAESVDDAEADYFAKKMCQKEKD